MASIPSECWLHFITSVILVLSAVAAVERFSCPKSHHHKLFQLSQVNVDAPAGIRKKYVTSALRRPVHERAPELRGPSAIGCETS